MQSIFHSSLPINQDIENSLAEVYEQYQSRSNQETLKAKLLGSNLSSQKPTATNVLTTFANDGGVRSKSAIDLCTPKVFDKERSNSASASFTEGYYDRSDTYSQYEVASTGSSTTNLQPKTKPVLIYDDYKYEVPIISKSGTNIHSGAKKDTPFIPPLRKAPSPPTFRSRDKTKRLISDSYSDRMNYRNTEVSGRFNYMILISINFLPKSSCILYTQQILDYIGSFLIRYSNLL